MPLGKPECGAGLLPGLLDIGPPPQQRVRERGERGRLFGHVTHRMVVQVHRLRPAFQVQEVPVLLLLAADNEVVRRPCMVVEEPPRLGFADVLVEVDHPLGVVGQFPLLDI